MLYSYISELVLDDNIILSYSVAQIKSWSCLSKFFHFINWICSRGYGVAARMDVSFFTY